MSGDASRSELIDRWDRIFRDICREAVCPPSVDDQPVDGWHLEVGWQRDAGGLDEKAVLHAEEEREFISELGGGGLKRWELDLGEFTDDLEEDVGSVLMLGGVGELDIDANGAEGASAAADLSGFVDLSGGEDFNDTASGLMQNAFIGLDSSKHGLADKWDMVLFSICLELERPVPYEGYSESHSQNFSGQQGSEHCLAEQGGLPVKMRDAHVGSMLAAVSQSQAGLNLDSPKDEPTLSRTCDRFGPFDRTRFREEAAANKCVEALGRAQGAPFRSGILQSRPALIGVRGVALASVAAFLGATAFLGVPAFLGRGEPTIGFWLLFGISCSPLLFLLVKAAVVAFLEGWRTDAVDTPRVDTGGITFEQMWGVIQGDSFAASHDGDEGNEVKPWDVDLGQFMIDVEEDADAAATLGGNSEFDLSADVNSEEYASICNRSDNAFFGQPILDEAFPPLHEQSEMLSSDFGLRDIKWRYSEWAPSGWLERCLCEPIDFFDNADPMHPWDTSAICEYGGPWRRKFEPVVRCFFWVLVAAAGPALLDLFYLGMVLGGAKESVFPSPGIAAATHFVAAGVAILWIIEMRAFWRKSRLGFFR